MTGALVALLIAGLVALVAGVAKALKGRPTDAQARQPQVAGLEALDKDAAEATAEAREALDRAKAHRAEDYDDRQSYEAQLERLKLLKERNR